MAFPSGVTKPYRPSGVRLQVVPPSSEIVDVEIHARTVGTTEAAVWIETIGAQQHYAFQEGLPMSTVQRAYSARCVATGKIPSTFTAEIICSPAELPFIGIGQGAAVETVLGEQLRIRLQGRDFHSNAHSTMIEYEETRLTLQSPTTGFIVTGSAVAIAPGSRLDRIEARMLRPTPVGGLVGFIQVFGNIVDQDGAYVDFGGALSGAGTTWATHTDMTLQGRKIADNETLSLTATIGLTTSLTNADPKLAWVDIYYTSTSYKSVRGG